MYAIHTTKDIYTVKSAEQFAKVRANVNDFTPIIQICLWVEGEGWVKVETMNNESIVTVTAATFAGCAGYNAQRTDKPNADIMFFSVGDFDALTLELWEGSDVVVTTVPEVVSWLEVARIPHYAAYNGR